MLYRLTTMSRFDLSPIDWRQTKIWHSVSHIKFPSCANLSNSVVPFAKYERYCAHCTQLDETHRLNIGRLTKNRFLGFILQTEISSFSLKRVSLNIMKSYCALCTQLDETNRLMAKCRRNAYVGSWFDHFAVFAKRFPLFYSYEFSV